VIKIIRGIVRHPDLLHDATRLCVLDDRERDDLLELQHPEAIVERAAGGLRGISMAPVLMGNAPADLDARREVGLEASVSHAAQADEIGDARDLYRQEPEPVLGEVRAVSRDLRHHLAAVEQ